MYESKQFWKDVKSGKFASMIKESSEGLKIANAEEVYNIMKPLFAEQDDVESFYCIFLNAKNKVLSIELMFSGSILGASVYPREIVKKVLSLKSTSVILIHNHPSGDTEPSSSDYLITVKIAIALDSIGVCVHDHIIVGKGYFSMAATEKLKTIQEKVTDFLNISIY
ncbi:MAG: DNA repair protein RadC [Desulfobacula sp.]|jgi:DNA repair protein RadC|nr:DNA repair protein RadC [Desulfobacula sp.]